MRGTATATRPYEVCIDNSVGGTNELPLGEYRVEIVRSFYDYEVGRRYIARLVDPVDRATAKEAARTLNGPADYEPPVVYFTEHVFREDPPEDNRSFAELFRDEYPDGPTQAHPEA